jgi:hypothetical protein
VYLLAEPEDSSLWQFSFRTTDGLASSLGPLSLPHADSLVSFEGLYDPPADPAGRFPRSCGFLVIGRTGVYEFGDEGLVAWAPDAARLRANEYLAAVTQELRLTQTGSCSWRFEACDRKTAVPGFSYSVQPHTPGERLNATVLDLLQLTRPPVQALASTLTSLEPPREWGQRLECLRWFLGPVYPRGWRLLHLLAALASGSALAWFARRRAVDARGCATWGVAGFLGGVIALPILALLMPANGPRAIASRISRASTGAASAPQAHGVAQ